ncbi:hypothetical protein M8Z33_26145 [Streptomyces sp. ZAF1911]|uniref:hypothetical protein n=1 Tax=Streptomyces sp. ZAF1911 TaxID=2944129 RepID=UPI00237B552D|nr:hypothetical protein [Streptomyces sp. ZAF1911]MDD9380076.1 hypothetical protein [Streptomyces sp. ZAF1911]
MSTEPMSRVVVGVSGDRAFEEALGGDPAGVPVVRRHVLRGDTGWILCEPAGRPDDLLVVGARPGRRSGGRVAAGCAPGAAGFRPGRGAGRPS